MVDEIVQKGKISHYGVSVWKISDAMEAIQFPNVKVFNLYLIYLGKSPLRLSLKRPKREMSQLLQEGRSQAVY